MPDGPLEAITESEDNDPPIVPESPSPEHVLFVVLGALSMVYVIVLILGVV